MVLQPEAYPKLIERIGDSPGTVIPLHFLLRSSCTVWTDDEHALDNVVLRTETRLSTSFLYGEDRDALMPLISEAGKCDMLLAPAEMAGLAQDAAEAALGVTMTREQMEQKSASAAPPVPPTPGYEVRRLTADDISLLETAPGELQWTCASWGSWERLLAHSIVVAAMADGAVVSVATAFGRSQRHDDIAVATAPEHESKGLCTACGATIMEAILTEGRVPVWTVMIANRPSFRVSEKLGFVTQSHCVALLTDKQEQA